MLGRDTEAAAISQFLSGIPDGPGVLLIIGEAGIGKTTVLQASPRQALGYAILSASPGEPETSCAYAALADLLEKVPAAVVTGLPRPQRDAIRQTVLRTQSCRRRPDPRTTATAVLSLLRRLASRHPVLLVIDDMQWLDASSARSLAFALRRLRSEPVGLLAAARADWPGSLPPLATDGLPAGRVTRLTLGPLSLGVIRDVLAARVGIAAGRVAARRLHETTGGNPLLALKLAEAMGTGLPAWPPGVLSLPGSLRRLMLRGAARLPPGPADVILVSALSAEPAIEVVCAAARDPATAHADLEAGIQAGILATACGQVGFVHPLMRAAAVAEAPAAQRRAAHRRLATTVRGAQARARHRALGADGPDEEIAAHLEHAAVASARRGAHAVSGELAELAVTLTPLAWGKGRLRRAVLAAVENATAADPARACLLLKGIIDAAPGGPAQGELWYRLAGFQALADGPGAGCLASLRRAQAEAGDDPRLRAVILAGQIVCASFAGQPADAIGHPAQAGGWPSGGNGPAAALLELAGRVEDRALAAQCHAALAFSSFVSGSGLRPDLMRHASADSGRAAPPGRPVSPGKTVPPGEPALPVRPRPAGRPESLAFSSPGSLQPRGSLQPPGKTNAPGGDEALGLVMELRPQLAVAHVRHWAGDLDGARILYEQEYATAVEAGVTVRLPLVLWALAENEMWAGNWEQAERLTAEGCRAAEDSSSRVAVALMLAVRGTLHACRGRAAAGLRDSTRAVELAGELGMPLAAVTAAQAFGIAGLAAGDARAVHERLAPLAAAVAGGVLEPALCRFLPDEIDALILLGQLGAAEELLGLFEARSARLGQGWGTVAASRCRGLLLAARGDLGGAETSLNDALTRHQRLPMPFELARSLLAAGEVQRRARRKRKAAEFLQAAAGIFERLGAPVWASRAREERGRVGIRAVSPATGTVLTAAERRVADLVAAGRTNAEIAAELFMGLRTVEAHLSRVYRKLGVRSRTGLCRLLLTPPASGTG